MNGLDILAAVFIYGGIILLIFVALLTGIYYLLFHEWPWE